MKLKQLFFFGFLAITISFASCKKENVEDNTPMIEKIAGEWEASEVTNGQLANFKVTINQATEGNIRIDDQRSPAPVYSLESFTFPFNAEDDTFELGTVKGIVESDNKITVDYAFGSGATIYNVELTLTR